ncbi:MAG: proton-conducting transporter membrane subunit [Candidatus Wallbacteria bacterium]
MAKPMVFLFFVTSTLIFLASSFIPILLKKQKDLSIRTATFFNIAGGLTGLLFSLAVLAFGMDISYQANYDILTFISTQNSELIRISSVSAFFLSIIYFISIICSLYSASYIREYKDSEITSILFFFPIFIIAMAMVIVSNHAVVFLIFWELMSLVSYFLVMTEHENPKTRTAGFTYLIMTHFGTAFLLTFFGIMYSYSGSFDFKDYIIASTFSDTLKTSLFIMLLIGFGTKAGIVPLHIWLPLAHPQAPAHISALMSGVMVKVAIYGFLRFNFEFLGTLNIWCGISLLVIASITTLLGIMYSVVETNLKKSLAYSTIENVGIIFTGISCAIILRTLGKIEFSAFAITALFYHIIAHALFKSLLFLNSGAVIYATHETDMDKMGGLINKMPYTSFYFLMGAMSMASLPPMAGFISEWLTFQSILLTLKSQLTIIKICVPLAGAMLALASSLACFGAVRGMFSIFLAKNREKHKYQHTPEEVPYLMKISMLILTIFCFVFGIFSPLLIPNLKYAVTALSGCKIAGSDFFTYNSSYLVPMHREFASISPIFVFCVLIAMTLGLKFIFSFMYSKMKIRVYETWSCGADIDSTMEYTPESYSQPLMVVFKKIYRPRTEIEVKHNQDRYITKKVTYTQTAVPFFEYYFYKPLTRFVLILSNYMKKMQVGYVHVYLLYIFITLLTLLFVARH